MEKKNLFVGFLGTSDLIKILIKSDDFRILHSKTVLQTQRSHFPAARWKTKQFLSQKLYSHHFGASDLIKTVRFN